MTLILQETDVEAFGKNDTIIAHATRLTKIDGVCIGVSYPPDAVRAVLYDTNLFLPSEIDAWPPDVSVLVPPGTWSFHWIPEAARFEGYAYKADYWRGPIGRVSLEPFKVNEEREYTGFVWARNGELLEGPVQTMEQAKL
jgi:hypothetical protein